MASSRLGECPWTGHFMFVDGITTVVARRRSVIEEFYCEQSDIVLATAQRDHEHLL